MSERALEHLLDEAGTAEALGMSQRVLQAWRARGGGPSYIRIGHRTIRCRPADIEKWLEERRFGSTAEEPRHRRDDDDECVA